MTVADPPETSVIRDPWRCWACGEEASSVDTDGFPHCLRPHDEDALSYERRMLIRLAIGRGFPGIRLRNGAVVYPLPTTYTTIAERGSDRLVELVVEALEHPDPTTASGRVP